jgi:hypothetical protein
VHHFQQQAKKRLQTIKAWIKADFDEEDTLALDLPKYVQKQLGRISSEHRRALVSQMNHTMYPYMVQAILAFYCIPLNVQIVCPTGIAANNIGGMTMHSFFRIDYKSADPMVTYTMYTRARRQFNQLCISFLDTIQQATLMDEIDGTQQQQIDTSMAKLHTFMRKHPQFMQLRTLDTLIMDEFSMVPPHLFFQMHHALCTARDDHVHEYRSENENTKDGNNNNNNNTNDDNDVSDRHHDDDTHEDGVDDNVSEDTSMDPVPSYANGPFGTVRLLIVGDLCQLAAIVPPHGSKQDNVFRGYLYTNHCVRHNQDWLTASRWKQRDIQPSVRKDSHGQIYVPRYTFDTNLYRYIFSAERNILQLEVSVRQASDPVFHRQLCKLRMGVFDDELRQYLRSLETTEFSSDCPPLFVYPTKKDVEQMNKRYLNSLLEAKRAMVKKFTHRVWVERILSNEIYGYYSARTGEHFRPSSTTDKTKKKQSKKIIHQVQEMERSKMFRCVPNFAQQSASTMRHLRAKHQFDEDFVPYMYTPWRLVPYPRVYPVNHDMDDIVEQLKRDVTRQTTSDDTISLIEELPVLLTRNLFDASYGIVNGSRGVVIGFAQFHFHGSGHVQMDISQSYDRTLLQYKDKYKAVAMEYMHALLVRGVCTLDPSAGSSSYEVPLVYFPHIQPIESVQTVSFEDVLSAEESRALLGQKRSRDEEGKNTNVARTHSHRSKPRGVCLEYFRSILPILPAVDRIARRDPPWQGIRIQIPLLAAAAVTVHKTQSLTIDAMQVYLGDDCWGGQQRQMHSSATTTKTTTTTTTIKSSKPRPNPFRFGQGYVVLSRLRTPNVRLVSWSEDSFVQDPHVIRYVRSFLPLATLQERRTRVDKYLQDLNSS